MKRMGHLLFCVLVFFSVSLQADVFRWDNGTKISDTDPVPGASFYMQMLSYAALDGFDLTDVTFSYAELIHAHFMNSTLIVSSFENSNLSYADLTGANLRDANFGSAILTNADLTDSLIQEARFVYTTGSGFTKEQLYSTASYKNGNLGGIHLGNNNLSGWDFSGQNMEEADFDYATMINTNLRGTNLSMSGFQYANLTGADLSGANLSGSGTFFFNAVLTGADLTGANLIDSSFEDSNFTNAILSKVDARNASLSNSQIAQAGNTQNLIRPSGHVQGGLYIVDGDWMRIRDYWDTAGEEEFPIVVEDFMTVEEDAVLRMIFEDDQWGSLITFETGIDVTLAGKLELFLDPDADWLSLVGTSYRIFDWTGANRTGTFTSIGSNPGCLWDTSELYDTGIVTLLEVPEPAAMLLLALGAALTHRRR